MIENQVVIVPIEENNEKTIPVAGFNARPENINRNGRPTKGHSITETIRAMMDEKPEIKRKLAEKIFQSALSGDVTAIKLIWSYLDGLPKASTDITTSGRPIPIMGGLSCVNSSHETSFDIE